MKTVLITQPDRISSSSVAFITSSTHRLFFYYLVLPFCLVNALCVLLHDKLLGQVTGSYTFVLLSWYLEYPGYSKWLKRTFHTRYDIFGGLPFKIKITHTCFSLTIVQVIRSWLKLLPLMELEGKSLPNHDWLLIN